MTSVAQFGDMLFADIYQTTNHQKILYDLLSEREAYESISHEEMPTFFQHEVFIASRPYRSWWFVVNREYGYIIGSVGITRQNEIAIAIYKEHRRQGWGKKIIKAILDLYPNIDFLANINPANQKSIDLFSGLGFKHVQNTYKFKR